MFNLVFTINVIQRGQDAVILPVCLVMETVTLSKAKKLVALLVWDCPISISLQENAVYGKYIAS